MCGIAGCYETHLEDSGRAFVAAAVEAQHRRGPDHSAIEEVAGTGASVLFGHNRLSIIDLSDAGNQPMWDAERRVCIVYNGEIYNYLEVRDDLVALGHTFHTQSDTEVILEAFKEWRGDAFERLNGMFAMALFDQTDGALWLVRDRFGVKPLYYALHAGGLLFASTPGPIARAIGCRPSLEYVARGIAYWLYEDDGDISPFEGINAVPPGHSIVAAVTSGHTSVRDHRWYDLYSRVADRREEIRAATDSTLLDGLGTLLESAVTLRLRADVPVAISLSGGLDSTSLGAIAAREQVALRGFTLGSATNSTTEGPLAAAAANQIGIDVSYTWPTPREGAHGFWETLDAQGAPFVGPSSIGQFMVFKDASGAGFKVLLGGQGADEVLMGYRKFQLLLMREALAKRDAGSIVSNVISLSLMLAAEASHASTYITQRARYLRREGLPTSLHLPQPAPMGLAGESARSPLERQLLDITRLSLPTLLRYEDRNSAGNGLESRLPYLDYRFVEFSAALPARLKVHNGYGKWALRQLMRGRIPSAIRAARYKRAFDAPRRSWVAAGLGRAIRERLTEERAIAASWLSSDTDVAELFSDARLTSDPTAFVEASSLLWLIQHAN